MTEDVAPPKLKSTRGKKREQKPHDALAKARRSARISVRKQEAKLSKIESKWQNAKLVAKNKKENLKQIDKALDGKETRIIDEEILESVPDNVKDLVEEQQVIFSAADDGTNPNIVDVGMGTVTLDGTQTLTNKTLTSPKIGTNILDTNGNELINFTATGSAVNELTIANAGTGVAGPVISATGETNVGININPKGTGVLKSGSAAVKIAGTETIWVPAAAMYASTTNGAAAEQFETTATRPDLKVLDYDAGTAEYAQFAIAMPKSWNLGTVTFQYFWAPSNTNTGNVIMGLQGVSVTNDDTADVVFGTAQEVTDAGGGAIEDVLVSSVSSAMTIAGSPADDDLTFFQLYRDAADGSDTFTGDARLLGIKLFYTTDAANDA